jgi:tetratricopeptide (TPR) repeat protein
MAMALHEALTLYGISYVIDPTTPYKEFSKKRQEIDFLQFPKQSLDYRAGDCDDLSILNCALLESVGIETAFVTIPGHIFMAFAVDMTPDEARKRFLRADELIFREDKTWIPVEITEIGGGFLKAWQRGAKQWRENVARGQAGFYPMHEAWSMYEPVGLPSEAIQLTLPDRDSIISAYLQELIKFIDREIFPQVAKIQAEIKKSKGNPKDVNRLGILYARYGLTDRAEREFKKILAKNKNFVPALVNLGNICYLNSDMQNALTYYERASKLAPENSRVLLCVARAHHELENYGLVKEAYNSLKKTDPDLAYQFSYLDLRGEEAVRAASISNVKEIVLWEE